MTISFPLTFPTAVTPSRIVVRAVSVVGISESPFTLEQQGYVHQGQRLEADISLPPMQRANAETFIAFLLALNGREGTFTMSPDPANPSPRGTWDGSPKVLGAHAAGVTSIAMDGFGGFATVKAGDWFQIGTGSATELHKVVQDATADSGGQLTLDIWPRTRAALADNDTFDTSSPVGLWRLASNTREWSIEIAGMYGLGLSVTEAL